MSDTPLREPKQGRSRRTLRRITSAALELIAENGVDGTTVAAIVQRAESSVGSFYARFRGKDDLLAYLDERIWEEAEERWNETADGRWGEGTIPEIVSALARLYAELESTHRTARDALALALRGPGATPSPAARRFKAKILGDSRRLLLERSASIRHPTPDLAVETTLRSLEASAFSLEPAVLADLCAALVQHLTGEHSPPSPPGEEVEFFDIWG